MSRYLIVANQTLGGLALASKIAQVTAPQPEGSAPGGDAEASLHIVVPVTETDGTHLWDYPPIDRYIPDAMVLARTLAQARLDHELERLRHLGIKADGELSATDPVARVKELVRQDHFDTVIVSTLPQGLSRWLRTDLPHRLSRALDIPVIHVEGGAGPSL